VQAAPWPELTEDDAMTLEKARELLAIQAQFGSGYNRNSARLILAEVQRGYGHNAVDRLIRELDLERIFGLAPGTDFGGVT
jgi:hypothetical protein